MFLLQVYRVQVSVKTLNICCLKFSTQHMHVFVHTYMYCLTSIVQLFIMPILVHITILPVPSCGLHGQCYTPGNTTCNTHLALLYFEPRALVTELVKPQANIMKTLSLRVLNTLVGAFFAKITGKIRSLNLNVGILLV